MSIRADQRRRRSRGGTRGRGRTAPCRDHHGRQWPLGGGARPAAERGPPPRRRGGAPDGDGARVELGIGHLTLFSFSSENWSRPPDEVELPLRPAPHVHPPRSRRAAPARACASRVIGERERLPPDIVAPDRGGRRPDRRQPRPAAGRRLQLWRPQRDRARGPQDRRRGRRRACSSPTAIDEAAISAHLDTAAIPDPDLIIRTGGEMRLSNFLLWQAAYAELVLPAALLARFRRGIAARRGRRNSHQARPPLWRPRRPEQRVRADVAAAPPRHDCRRRDLLIRTGSAAVLAAFALCRRLVSAARRPGSSPAARGGGRLARMGAASPETPRRMPACWPFTAAIVVATSSPASASSAVGFVIAGGTAIGLALARGRDLWPAGRHRLCRPARAQPARHPAVGRTMALTALLFVFAVVWATDTGAFFAGRLDRRRQALAGGFAEEDLGRGDRRPGRGASSPGSSSASAAPAAAAAGARSRPPSPVGRLPAGRSLRIGREAPLRRQGFGHIIPGHGGLMDRVDGLVFACALAALIGWTRGGADHIAEGLLLW